MTSLLPRSWTFDKLESGSESLCATSPFQVMFAFCIIFSEYVVNVLYFRNYYWFFLRVLTTHYTTWNSYKTENETLKLKNITTYSPTTTTERAFCYFFFLIVIPMPASEFWFFFFYLNIVKFFIFLKNFLLVVCDFSSSFFFFYHKNRNFSSSPHILNDYVN